MWVICFHQLQIKKKTKKKLQIFADVGMMNSPSCDRNTFYQLQIKKMEKKLNCKHSRMMVWSIIPRVTDLLSTRFKLKKKIKFYFCKFSRMMAKRIGERVSCVLCNSSEFKKLRKTVFAKIPRMMVQSVLFLACAIFLLLSIVLPSLVTIG